MEKPLILTLLLASVAAVFIVLMSIGAAPALAQPRDGGLEEQRIEEEAGKCREDPECMAWVARSRAKDAEIQRQYEAKPWIEKAIPWAIIIGGFAAIFFWPSRQKGKK